MNKNIKILDTTLRDGGRVVNGRFYDDQIMRIVDGLLGSNIDIIELGFLRGNVEYKGDSTYFTEMEQIERFIPLDRGRSEFVIFGDYGKEFGMWDYGKLIPRNSRTVDGFRIGYRKKDLHSAMDVFKAVKGNGYKLFIQGVESLSYTDKEMLETLEAVNEIAPAAFGIVDTYGAMYKADVLRLFTLVHNNLDEKIAIDFHSHNNMQLSFSFGQEIAELNMGMREIVLDASMEGLGAGAGNLNTELIADYLNRKHFYTYDLDRLFDTIDENVSWIKSENRWGYEIPHFMAGVFSSHTNNIIYLMEKKKLSTRDIKNILDMVKPESRKRYDYDNLEKIFIEYHGTKCVDDDAKKAVKEALTGRNVLILVPGSSLTGYKDEIEDFIKKSNPVIISVNFISMAGNERLAFFGNPRRYKQCLNDLGNEKAIITSNIQASRAEDIVINYNSNISRGYKYFDNSTIMLLNFLRGIGITDLSIAGLDGFDEKITNQFFINSYNTNVERSEYPAVNDDLDAMLNDYAKTLKNRYSVKFITPNAFQYIFS